MKKLLFIIFSFFVFSSSTFGHGDHDHHHEPNESLNLIVTDEMENKYIEINENYVKNIKPIFQRTCFDCHGGQTVYPWYYRIPGIKQIIDRDIEESKVHLDFSEDFPFLSHDNPFNDLEAISKSLSEETMPPKLYSLMHMNKKITKNELDQVEEWIFQSKLLLNQE